MRVAQAAVEYITMVAIALIMVAMVVKLLHKIAIQTGETISNAAELLNRAVISALSNATSE